MLTGLVNPRYSPSSTTVPRASTARAAFRRRLRTASRAMSARLAKCVAAPRAARPPTSMDSGMKRSRRVWSSWPSKLPASCARTNPRPAPARQIQAYRRRLPGSAAVFFVADSMAVLLVEPAAEKAGAIDQIQPLGRGCLNAGRLRVFDQMGHRSLGPGGPIAVETAQDMVLVAIHPDDGGRRRGILDFAFRPEAERGVRHRAARPELHLEVVVRGEGEDLAQHFAYLVQDAVGLLGGDRVRRRGRWSGWDRGLRFRGLFLRGAPQAGDHLDRL